MVDKMSLRVVKLPVWAASSPCCFDVFGTGILGKCPALGWCLLQLRDGRCEGSKLTSSVILTSSLPPSSLTRLGLILLLLQYLAEFFFHMARLVYFTDENNEKL